MNRQSLRFKLLSTKLLSTKLLSTKLQCTMYKFAFARVKRMPHVSLVTVTVVILSVALTSFVQAKQSAFAQAQQSATKKQDQHSKQSSENRVHVVEHSEEIYELEIMNESEMVKRIVARIKQRQDGADANHVRKAGGIGVIAEAHAAVEPGRFQFAIEAPQEHYWIGVRCEPLTLLTKSQLKLDFGLAVQEVVPQSPAENAGIVVHDILFRMGDQKLETTIDLVNAVNSQKSQVAEFEVMRGGRNITVNIQPQRRPQLETEQIVLGVFEDSKFDSVKVDAQLQKIKGWVKTQTNASGRNLEVLLVRPGVAFDEKKLKSQQFQLVSQMGEFIYMRDPALAQPIIQSIEPIKFRGNVNSMVHLRFSPQLHPASGSPLRSRNEVVVFPNTPQNLPNFVLRSSEPGIWVTAAQAGDQDHLHSVLATSLDRQANQLMDRIIELESRHRAIAEFIADSENREIPAEQINALQQNQTEVQKSIKKFREHHARLMQRIHSFSVSINTTGNEIHPPANPSAPINSQFQRRPSIDPPPVEGGDQPPSGSNSGNHPD
jgi:hypothetical protein